MFCPGDNRPVHSSVYEVIKKWGDWLQNRMNRHVQTLLETEQVGQKLVFSYKVVTVSYRDHMESDKNSWDDPKGFRHELSLIIRLVNGFLPCHNEDKVVTVKHIQRMTHEHFPCRWKFAHLSSDIKMSNSILETMVIYAFRQTLVYGLQFFVKSLHVCKRCMACKNEDLQNIRFNT